MIIRKIEKSIQKILYYFFYSFLFTFWWFSFTYDFVYDDILFPVYLMLLFASMPISMLICNAVHELGHFAFCKEFNINVTRIKIGIIQYDFTTKKIEFADKGLIGGNCAFMIKDGLKPIAYFLIFMGGVITNFALLCIMVILYIIGIKKIVIFSFAVCCILNIAANGLYRKSTDRKLLKDYLDKSRNNAQ